MGSRAPRRALWLLPGILLCFSFSPPPSSQNVTEVPGTLLCGHRSFQFTVNLSQEAEAPPVLIAWDNQSLPHRLQNDTGCGTWLTDGPGSTVVLEATYNSCYATQWGFYYIMVVGVEGEDVAGPAVGTKKRLLKCPVDLPGTQHADLCDSVPPRDRLSCAPSPISQGDCEDLGCCYNLEEGMGSCYYGNTVTSHCTREGHFSIAVSRNVTSPPLRLESLRLVFGNDSGCDPVMVTPTSVLFQFPFSSCGTTRRITGDQAVYENELVAMREMRTWGRGSITRDSTFRLQVRCSYSVLSNTSPVNMQVLTLPPPVPKPQPGPLSLELHIAKDENYSSYYAAGDYPLVKILRDPIYVEVSVLRRTDPALGLLLQQCWATPSPNPLHQPQWPILVKGCPFAGDNYQTQQIPVQKASSRLFPSHHQRLKISTFGFMDLTRAEQTLSGQVYLHCSASVCQLDGTPFCTVTCPARRRKPELHFENGTTSVSSKGPMILLQATKDPSDVFRNDSGPPMGSPALWVAGLSGTMIIVGGLFISFVALRKWR
ncbi:zona pellucida sperm-binding protein 4 [Nannospalax galili]|uniref:zona pellucida sperm-binding protein 4 n=1 Tax=Nannospalax galili TaxID=1026970 RepID=UPI0004ED720D|nr:zona pellucida sperm-binding protein 4 [Nannospalax galili]